MTGRVLVTGGSGFLGKAVVAGLLETGSEVTVADLVEFPGEGVRQVIGDLRERDVVARAVTEGLDGVVHLAALTSVLESANRPEDTFTTNVSATALLLESARLTGVPRFIFASTNAVVGETRGAEIDEETPLHPLTPYGATKAAAEMLIAAYGASYGIAATTLRFTNIYGPGMARKDSVVARLMKAAMSGGSIEIYGDGEQVRDYLYVGDAVKAIEAVWDRDASGTFTVGAGSSVSMNEIHSLACRATGVDISAARVPRRPGEMMAVSVDNSRMRGVGWEPDTALREGLQQTWGYFRRLPGG